MKKNTIIICIALAVIEWSNAQVTTQKVGINSTQIVPSAVLELESTNKGFLPPRMTQAQRNAIASPVTGLLVYCTNCGYSGEMEVYDGTAWRTVVNGITAVAYTHCNTANPTSIVEVTNPTTGKVWMDRNLGANRAATSTSDAESFGSLFQWGRGADGHQCVNRYMGDGVTTSGTTTTLSSTDIPVHANFITTSASPNDWRSPQNDNLWQGVIGINNPCPTGYRLPTETELTNERLTWSINGPAGAIASPLKLPPQGFREKSNGVISGGGANAGYWSSTISGTDIRRLAFDNGNNATIFTTNRSFGLAVRCIKN